MATTMKLAALTILLLNFTPLSAYISTPCKIPPRFWCDNQEVAAKCGVEEQCKQNVRQDADKVELALYYESLCPDCKTFINHMLFPNFTKLSSIMNVTLVPYGNTEEKFKKGHWVFRCQFGKDDCLGNIIETCTIAIVKDINKYLPFINCLEASKLKHRAAAKKCASQFPVPLKEIMNCTKSDYGNKLEHEMAVLTDALQPPHTSVPWITVNGVHTHDMQREAENNLVKLICDTYTGLKPAVCK